MAELETDARARAIAALRAVADLIEQHPEIELPQASISWHLLAARKGCDVHASIKTLLAACPGPWVAEIHGTTDWLHLSADLSDQRRGVSLLIATPAADVGVKAGTRARTQTVLVWELPAAVATATGTETVERT